MPQLRRAIEYSFFRLKKTATGLIFRTGRSPATTVILAVAATKRIEAIGCFINPADQGEEFKNSPVDRATDLINRHLLI